MLASGYFAYAYLWSHHTFPSVVVLARVVGPRLRRPGQKRTTAPPVVRPFLSYLTQSLAALMRVAPPHYHRVRFSRVTYWR